MMKNKNMGQSLIFKGSVPVTNDISYINFYGLHKI